MKRLKVISNPQFRPFSIFSSSPNPQKNFTPFRKERNKNFRKRPQQMTNCHLWTLGRTSKMNTHVIDGQIARKEGRWKVRDLFRHHKQQMNTFLMRGSWKRGVFNRSSVNSYATRTSELQPTFDFTLKFLDLGNNKVFKIDLDFIELFLSPFNSIKLKVNCNGTPKRWYLVRFQSVNSLFIKIEFNLPFVLHTLASMN